MWYLSSENEPRVIYVLPGKDIIIGRSADGQNCNFAVPGDPSLSRKHASLSIVDRSLILSDLGSKYGTFINNSQDKLDSSQKLTLNVNDIVKFGKMNCEWKVEKVNFVTCTSTLKGENIENLKMILNKLGGVFKSDWDDTCTYLTMPAITLTIKVVLALVQGAYIVTTDYWIKCIEAISQNAKLPEPANFTPQVVESTLNKESVAFIPDESRKTLFEGKNIIFFSKRQLEMYKMVLEKSSATAMLLSDTKLTKSMLCADNVIVIQYNMLSTSQETESQKEQIKDIVNYLRSKGKRVVADAEIGLAILYCSTEKYCNPDFNFATVVTKQSTTNTTKLNNVLAQESQNTSQALLKKENIKIDESLSAQGDILVAGSGHNELITGKRKLNEDEVISSINKKMALSATANLHTNNIGGKRTAEDDVNNSNPSKRIAVEASGNDDSFNFIKSSNKKTDNCSNELNLMKPIKRKMEQEDDEEGLFNFVRKKAATENNTDNNSHANQKDIERDGDSDSEIITMNRMASVNDKIDVKALRGAKLSELQKQNLNMEVNDKIMKIVKTENNDYEDFGSTVVVVRSDLIVKREPLQIKEESESSTTSTLKNFKKFKKVWPLKIQISMSKLSLNAI